MDDVVIHYEWDDAHLMKHPVITHKNTSLSCDDNDVDIRETVDGIKASCEE